MSVFDFDDYKRFLEAWVGPRTQRTGRKSLLARDLRCQVTYVSQVLYRNAHLSLEQAEAAARTIGLSTEESSFFLLLVQKARAGTPSLRRHFEMQIERALESRLNVKQRLGREVELSDTQRATYYSAWHYAAAHMALTIPPLRTRAKLRAALELSDKQLTTALDFLIESGLAVKEGESYVPTQNKVRLGNESALAVPYHTQWRAKAMQSITDESVSDLHYSGVYSVSRKDALVIKDRMLEFLREQLKTIHASPEEELRVMCLDWFQLSSRR